MSRDIVSARQLLRGEFTSQAEWRWQKALEYPDDHRNKEAAKIFDQFTAQVDGLKNDLVIAFVELFDEAQDTEQWLEMLKATGFHYWPENAAKIVADFIKERTGGGQV
jgi:hypothetical protein